MIMPQCPRCAECKGSSHHWLENSDFGDDPAEDHDHPTNVSHVCKHCPATGLECESCDSTGEYVIDGEYGVECPDCNGEGVILGATFDFETGKRLLPKS